MLQTNPLLMTNSTHVHYLQFLSYISYYSFHFLGSFGGRGGRGGGQNRGAPHGRPGGGRPKPN